MESRSDRGGSLKLQDWIAGNVQRMHRDEQLREHTLRAFRFDGACFPEAGFLAAVKAGARHSNADYRDYDDRVEIGLNRGDKFDRIRDTNLACRIDVPQTKPWLHADPPAKR